MFNEAEYQTVWMIYLAAAVCCWLAWTQLTRWIGWWFIREPLWILMAVILFTPSRVDPMEPWQAPAFIGWLLEALLGTGGDTAALLAQLALVGSLAMVADLGFVCLRLGWRHWRGGRTAARSAGVLFPPLDPDTPRLDSRHIKNS